MEVCLIAIGNELLAGYTINSNAAYMGQRLTKAGFAVTEQIVVPDEPQAIEQAISAALERATIVITTGGLGPTLDDITRASISRVMECDLHFDSAVAKDLHSRYGTGRPNIDDQAMIPSKAKALINPVGTAPGFLFHEQGKTLAVLPGVPQEMESLFTHQLLPMLNERYRNLTKPHVASVNTIGIPEPEVDQLVRKLDSAHPEVKFGIYPNQGIVIVRMSAPDASLLKQPEAALRQAFRHALFDSEEGSIAEAVHCRFRKSGKTLSCAESCTGGAIATALTRFSGASDYFMGSLVTYSNALKHGIIGVPTETLERYGAVSEQTVEAMLRGLHAHTHSDWGVAVTGVAGPSGGTESKPVGTVWCAVGQNGEKPHIWQLHLKGDRAANIARTVNLVLGKLFDVIT